MNLPTASDIDESGSPDARVACKHFLGKTLDQAEAMFRDNALYYHEDLMWMGPVAFDFYVEAALRYLESDDTSGTALDSFAAVLEFRLEQDQTDFMPVAERLVRLCRRVEADAERLTATPEIAAELTARYRKLLNTFTRAAQNHS